MKTAFLATRCDYSCDRVVADPELNRAFLDECRRWGLLIAPRELNSILLNLRKAGDLRGLKSKRTSFKNQEDYGFASEIAIRYLERRDGLSLDQVLSDPDRATEFDGIAGQIAPGYRPLQYRWAALRLRKTRRLKPEPLGRALRALRVEQFAVSDLSVDGIPDAQGLYVFFEGTRYLYAGEAKSLRKRIRKHLQHSDNPELARWLWRQGTGDLRLEIHVLDPSTTARVRRAMELELIRSRQPDFNVAGVG